MKNTNSTNFESSFQFLDTVVFKFKSVNNVSGSTEIIIKVCRSQVDKA